MKNCSVAVQVLPMNLDETNTLAVVDQFITFIASKTDQYEVASFETTIEGEYAEVMQLVNEAIKLAGEVHPDLFVNMKVRYKGEGQVLTTNEKTAKYRK